MFKFDNDFLESVGLGGIPDEQKNAFLGYAQDQLETRIGERMSAGMTDAQLDEFEKIIDNDPATIERWKSGLGDYKSDEIYQKLATSLGGTEEQVLNNYITSRWLNQNCPQYQQIIQESIDSLKQEIIANKDGLLASMQ